jgi:hypothetical protein
MSIPERIWRIVRGRWLLAGEQVQDALAETAAARELAESVRPTVGAGNPLPSTSAPPSLHSGRGAARPAHDPLAADLALLGAPPACDMDTLDRVYRERLRELEQEGLPGGTSEVAILAARRVTLSEAYERLRDAINTTETRFEKIEF